MEKCHVRYMIYKRRASLIILRDHLLVFLKTNSLVLLSLRGMML